ncbi:nucleoside kinase [Prevotella veroralis]|uniref:Phosphoribulokinase/uridine kinase family protein n=1 Tax=Prevotella veroralis F0319 TaxID=649761 RepID=C9MPD3_9BACT|nr:nucleoside kinase [Prevotella veroralis]EEX18936.1 phosphoribulokinase/uridine kinase family protein [Prevotella veroralis F0319]QUB40743.1 nucleoside kinase [Prevotella veroralis]
MLMTQLLHIRCKNNKKSLKVPMGSTLSDIFKEINLQMPYGPVSAKVNNKVEGLHYRVYHNKDVEYLDLHTQSGIRTYTRSLFLVLCKAVHDLYSRSEVIIDIPVSNGYYCNLKLGHAITAEDVNRIRTRMQEIVNAHLPIQRFETTTEEAIDMFSKLGDEQKAKLLKSSGTLYTVYYVLDDYKDYYYGSMLTNTSQLYLFGLEPYFDGVLLRIPSVQDPSQLGALIRQDKMFEVFKEHHRWQSLLGIKTVGDFNEAVGNGEATNLINVSEALQEKKISQIADKIAAKKDIKVVLIAGPSSSGKTTFCKRLSVQLLASGVKPVQISLDDYFVNREETPKDEQGEYDYESIYALNIPLINEQFNALFNGQEVELPKYNFQTGSSEKSGNKLHLEENNVLVVEGIHALNPTLTAQIPDDKKFKIYASALTTILLDNHNYIPTTDNRLLRRIVRDYKYRGCSAQETIRRWPSVRSGENKWIFPYQEQADVMFNTAMLFELAVIKPQAEEVLEQVPENCEEYAEAYRLRKFLKYFSPLPFRALPPTSLLREFLGGSSFKY